MDLNSLIIFDKVAELSSFTAAAKALKIPKSNVSLKISQLEESLGLRLFERSTRKVRLTEHGEKIKSLTPSLLDSVHAIRAAAEDVHEEPRGKVRISAPYDLGALLVTHVVTPCLQRYPEVSIELDLSNRYVDLIHEGFDLAIRASMRALQDSTLVAVKLSVSRLRFFARPGTALAKIRRLEDLPPEQLITFGGTLARVQRGQEQVALKSHARLKVFDMLTAKQAVLAGIGVGFLPEFVCLKECQDGDLINILPEWSSEEGGFHAVYPTRRMLPPKTRVLIEVLREAFTAVRPALSRP